MKEPVSIPLRKRFGLHACTDRAEADQKFRENWDRVFAPKKETPREEDVELPPVTMNVERFLAGGYLFDGPMI